MNSTAVLITISSLSLITSTTSLAILAIMGRRGLQAKTQIEAEVASVRKNTRTALDGLKSAIETIDI